MPRRPGGTWLMSIPLKHILPAVGCSMPEIMFIVVVLPQPDGPSSATNSLSLMVKVRSLTAFIEPKNFVRFIRSIAAIVIRAQRTEIVDFVQRSVILRTAARAGHAHPSR